VRGVLVRAPGGPDVLEVTVLPAPLLARGEVLIRVDYAATNWGDVQKRQGIYPDPVRYPVVLGAEVAGVVTAVGPGVSRVLVGQRIAALCGPGLTGGYAELVAVPSDYVIRIPQSLSLAAAAAAPLAMLTAYHLLSTAYSLRAGERVLIHAAAGSVGLALVQITRLKGATAIGTVGRASKVPLPYEHGASLVIDRSRDDFVPAVMEFTAGRGVDLVIDSLGGQVLPRSFDALRPYGHLINIGEASGEPDFPVRKKLYERSTSMAGFELLHAQPGSAAWERGVRWVFTRLASGELSMPISEVLPLDDVRTAHERFERGETAGKMLLEPRHS
jgi:NADPH2:quinone reductase